MIELPTEDNPEVLHCGDAIEFLDALPESSVDLVIGSPPYLDARTYEIDAVYDCDQWVAWMLELTTAAVRVSKGLVLWVAAGVQRDLVYWPGCEGLMWKWWKAGNHLWRPCIWHKVDDAGGGTGIPGSGGKQWFRNDWEYVMAFKREGWLPYADNTAMGHEPVYAEAGGPMSNRTVDGSRVNDDPWDKHGRGNNVGGRRQDGTVNRGTTADDGFGGKFASIRNRGANGKRKTKTVMDITAGHDSEGNLKENGSRPMPAIANPGNLIAEPMEPGMIVRARVGGGHMGNDLCHKNEAPYPEKLPEFFIKSFTKPGDIVCDCFTGSGTTAAVAKQWGRLFVGCDIRQSQIDLTIRRLATVQRELFV